MDSLVENINRLTNSEKIKYVIIIGITIYIVSTVFSSFQNKTNTILYLLVSVGIIFVFFYFDTKNKKTEENNLQSINDTNINYDIIKKHDIKGFQIIKSIVDLKFINIQAFENFVAEYNEFLLLKHKIINTYSINLRNLFETFITKQENILNELISITHNTENKQDFIRIELATKRMYTHLRNDHILEVVLFLKNKWKEETINVHSFPLHIREYKIKPSNLKNDYNKHFSVY